jgi:hypothetical protein
MAYRKITKRQTLVYQMLHGKVKIEQHKQSPVFCTVFILIVEIEVRKC